MVVNKSTIKICEFVAKERLCFYGSFQNFLASYSNKSVMVMAVSLKHSLHLYVKLFKIVKLKTFLT